MSWKRDTVKMLRQYEPMSAAVQNIPLELQRLELHTPAGEETPSGGTLELMIKKKCLQRSLENARLWLQAADRALSILTPEERLMLHRFYICPMPRAAETLSEDLLLEKASIYRRRTQALRRFAIAFYGIEL